MSTLASVESTLDDYLVKQAPFQIPAGGREWIVEFGPWIALILLLFSIPAILAVFALGSIVGAVSAVSGHTLGLWYGPYLAILIAQVVLMAVAIPKLMRREKAGWNLAFYYELAGVVMSLVVWVPHFQILNLFWSLLGDLIGLYVLFQIRSYYR